MIDYPPLSAGTFHNSAVTLRPPFIVGRIGMDDGVIRRILPRSVDALRAGTDYHMAGGRPCCSALCRGQIIVTVVPCQLRRLQAHTLRVPFLRIFPALIHFFCFSSTSQAIVGERGHLSVTGKEIALPLGSHNQSGVNASNLQVDRLRPRPMNILCRDNPVGTTGRVIEVIGVAHLLQVWSPRRAGPCSVGPADRFPMEQVSGMPYQESRQVVESRVSHIVVITVFQHRRIGIIAGHQQHLCRCCEARHKQGD